MTGPYFRAGFTTGKPWLKVPPSAKQYNVAAESKDPNSILNCYKRLLSLRQSETALRDGDQVSINNDDPNVFAYLRKSGNETIVVALNMSAQPHTIHLDLKNAGVRGSRLVPLYSSPRFAATGHDRIALDPFASFVARVE